MLLLSLIFSFSVNAQVNVQKTNYLIKNILPSQYNVEIVIGDEDSGSYMFVPRERGKTSLFKARGGTLLTNSSEDLEDSDIIVQSWSEGGSFEFYTAEKVGDDWKMHRFTDGNFSSKNLTYCETDKKAEGLFDLRTPMHCVFASERLCKKPESSWPNKAEVSKKQFAEFLGSDLEKGLDEYIRFAQDQSTALRDRVSNTYKLDNFKTVNRLEQAYKMDDGFKGDAVRGAVLRQVKSLCAKAWSHHNQGARGVPVKNNGGGASKLQKTRGVQ